jgi:hypothetical protein
MDETTDLADIRQQTRHLLELLDRLPLAMLDFNNREHLQVIELCIATAISHLEKLNKV